MIDCSGHAARDLEVNVCSPREVESAVWLKKHFLSGQVKSSGNGLDLGDVTTREALF